MQLVQAARKQLHDHGVPFAPPARTLAPMCGDEHMPNTIRTFSQIGEDRSLLQHYFWGVTHGTFIEIGAYNGVWMSNTKMFERYFGWSGLLIEANPALFKEVSAHRDLSTRANAAVCDAVRRVTFGNPAHANSLGQGQISTGPTGTGNELVPDTAFEVRGG